jgi:hypothetical protein
MSIPVLTPILSFLYLSAGTRKGNSIVEISVIVTGQTTTLII